MEFPVRPGIVGHAQKFPFLVHDHRRLFVQFYQFDISADYRLHLLQREVGAVCGRVPSVLMICVIVVQDYVLYRVRHDIFFQQGAVCVFPGFPPYVPS